MQGVFAESLLRKEGRVGCVHSRFQVSKFPNTRPNVPAPFSPSLFYTQPYILSRYVSISRSSTQFFQVNVKSQWTHPLQWEIILIYWLCRRILQPFVWWGNTQRLRFLIIFSFGRKPGKSVDQSGHKINTVEPRLTKTSVIRSPRYYVHFFLAAQQNGHTFSGKNKTLVNTVTR